MKSLVCLLTILFSSTSVLLLTGCNTVSTSHQQEIGGPRFAPSDPSQVQILRTEPARPHVRLGEVRAEPANENTDASIIEAALRKEAAKLGADAAVVVYDRTQVTGAQVVGGFLNRSVETITGRVIVAVAIKYR
jgi:hypothetical protein